MTTLRAQITQLYKAGTVANMSGRPTTYALENHGSAAASLSTAVMIVISVQGP